MTENDGYTFDVDEMRRRIRAAREALLEAENYCNTWEEAERKKKAAEPEQYQTE
jgi:hypothetical protein